MPKTIQRINPIDQEQTEHDRIAALAHQLWEMRGRPEGSPEQDWSQAEMQLRLQDMPDSAAA